MHPVLGGKRDFAPTRYDTEVELPRWEAHRTSALASVVDDQRTAELLNGSQELALQLHAHSAWKVFSRD